MNIFVAGSIAYDRIMDFSGRFSDHIVPDKLHMLNISFAVNSVTERPGGTAGNIAYALRLLGETPTIVATIGKDYHSYFDWLKKVGIKIDALKVVEDEATACAYIITDLDNNQITAFNPGAMKHSSSMDLSNLEFEDTIGIIAPGNIDDMTDFAKTFRAQNIRFIFDPGQSLPAWEPKELVKAIQGAQILISNEYEMALINDKTGLSKQSLLELTDVIITTKGEEGSAIIDKYKEINIPAIKSPETFIDPIGAGDAYRGGLIRGLATGKTLIESAQIGTTAASFAVEVHGTQEYSFTHEEFNRRLGSHFG